jgi:hypothetical protein
MVFNIQVNPSAHSRNKYGEIGSPCRIPRVGLKEGDKAPFTLTAKLTEVTHFIIREHHLSGKPRAIITS